uniref:Integrator complex subunit 9 homolog n=1 Tax=Schistocephalus solidus TaxID=70667 RepID=A0A0X3PQW1_SCHSO
MVFCCRLIYCFFLSVQTLALGGHVLVPCLPSGLVFQLLESIATAKHHFNGHLLEAFDRHFELDPSPSSSDPQVVDLATDQPPAKNTTSAKGVIHNSVNSSISGGGVSLMSLIAKCPLLFISSQAKASLAYANACGEWLSPDREKSLYTADSPFPFESLIRTGQMATLSSLHSPMSVDPKLDCAAVANGSSNPSSAPSFFTLPRRVNTGPTESQARSDVAGIEGGLWPALPCVFFTGHPSCRLGSAVHLIRALAYGGLRTEGFTKGPPPQHSVILVQSDEFLSSTGLHGTPQSNLVRLMRPFMDGCANEMSNQHSSILRLNNDAAAVYWIPIRAGITMNQLSRILTSCGFPKQTLILPSEVSASSELQVSGRCSVHHLAHNEELSVELAAPSLLPVHISPAILKSALPLSINLAGNTSTTTMTTTTTKVSNRPSDPRAAANRTPEPASQKPLQLALLSGRLHFRDGLYRLDEVDSTEAPTLGASSPGVMRPPSPSSATVSAASGTARTLIAKTSALDPQRLIKALTESGVTGGQLAGPELLAKYLEQEARQIGLAGRIQMTCSASPLGPLTASNSALILFPNSSVRILLWDSGSHVVCQDEGTRQAIRGALISCAEMACIPPYT